MDERRIGQSVRALRRRAGWRQADLALRAGVSQPVVSRVEAGRWDELKWSVVFRVCSEAGLRLSLEGRWRGGELPRLLDAAHAGLQERLKRRLEGFGWVASAEVTYSRYGERGSIDLLAWHPGSGLLLVVEVKSSIADVQGLLRPLDAKVRLASGIARDLGWAPRGTVPCLAAADTTTNRRRLAEHSALFSRFAVRSRAAATWLRRPVGPIPGLLLLLNPPPIPRGNGGRVGRPRSGRGPTTASVDPPAVSVSEGSNPAFYSPPE